MKQREDMEIKGDTEIKQVCSHCCCSTGFFSLLRLCSPTPLYPPIPLLSLYHTFSLALPTLPTMLNIYSVLKPPTHTHNDPESSDEFR